MEKGGKIYCKNDKISLLLFKFALQNKCDKHSKNKENITMYQNDKTKDVFNLNCNNKNIATIASNMDNCNTKTNTNTILRLPETEFEINALFK